MLERERMLDNRKGYDILLLILTESHKHKQKWLREKGERSGFPARDVHPSFLLMSAPLAGVNTPALNSLLFIKAPPLVMGHHLKKIFLS